MSLLLMIYQKTMPSLCWPLPIKEAKRGTTRHSLPTVGRLSYLFSHVMHTTSLHKPKHGKVRNLSQVSWPPSERTMPFPIILVVLILQQIHKHPRIPSHQHKDSYHCQWCHCLITSLFQESQARFIVGPVQVHSSL